MVKKKKAPQEQILAQQIRQSPSHTKEVKINANDASYREYFGYLEVMEQFLEFFIPERLRGKVKYATLRRYDSQNITRNWTDSREDLIWYAQTHKTVPRDLYTLLEFQSDVSQEMLFRFGQYTFIVYRALFDEKALKMTDGSTLLLPIVIYNGEKPWSAFRSMREMHDPREQDLEEGFQVQFTYFVIDIGRLDKKLLEQDCLPGRLFRLERVKDEKELIWTVKDIAARFRVEEGHQELARILCGWVKRVGLKRLKIDVTQFEAIHELEEIGAMLENVLPNWEARIREDAKKEEKNDIAKKLLDVDEAIEKIIQITGLSREDILALKKEYSQA